MPVKVRRIDFSPDEWIAGTLGMTLEEEGLYTRIVARIYSRGEALPADPGELAALCGVRPQTVRRILPKLLPKLRETDGKLTSNRCETELKLARFRVESAQFNGAKGGRPKGLAKAGGFPEGKPNHQLSPSKKINLLRAGGSPPLPSQGDGDAPPAPTTTTKAEPEAGTVFDDPALKAEAIAMLDQCLAAIRGKSEPFGEAAE